MIEIGIIIFPLIFLISCLWIRQFAKSSSVVDQWAKNNNFVVLQKQFRFIAVGPFWYKKNRFVFRVKLKTDKGLKYAWILVGDLFLINSNQVKVTWDNDHDNQSTQSFKKNIYFFTATINLVITLMLLYLFALFVMVMSLRGTEQEEIINKFDIFNLRVSESEKKEIIRKWD